MTWLLLVAMVLAVWRLCWGARRVTKPLDPDIKAMRAINRALAALPDDAHVQRVLEWTVARAAMREWVTLPRLRWIYGEGDDDRV